MLDPIVLVGGLYNCDSTVGPPLSSMANYSAKRRKHNYQADKVRKPYKSAWPFCQVPGCTRRAAPGIHEISRGTARKGSIITPAAFLRPCLEHHIEFDDYSIWPITRQLALKKLIDPANYDRVAVNKLRGQQPESITESEVDAYVPELEALLNDNGEIISQRNRE